MLENIWQNSGKLPSLSEGSWSGSLQASLSVAHEWFAFMWPHLRSKQMRSSSQNIKATLITACVFSSSFSALVGEHNMKPTTVWWLTWMTSSPAWIFLQRSAGDFRQTTGRQKRKRCELTWNYGSLGVSGQQVVRQASIQRPWNDEEEIMLYHQIWRSELERGVYMIYPFSRSCDDMEAIICWLDVHPLMEGQKNGHNMLGLLTHAGEVCRCYGDNK